MLFGHRSSDVSGSGSEASSQASRPLRRVRRGVPFDQIDCHPTIYHPGGIFEELSPLPPELLRDPRAQSWGNVFDSCSSHKTSAQAIAAHSHLRWPDLSREWIRRQEARIARVDWESRLPVVLGPRKSRLSLFTRKQQKLLDEARKMDGVPDQSVLLKGKLQLLSKKSTPANVQGSTSCDGGGASKERAPGLVDEGIGQSLLLRVPKRKRRAGKPRGKQLMRFLLKRPLLSMKLLRDLVETDPSEAVPEDLPRKKKKKKSIEAEPRPSDVEATLVDVATRGGVSPETPLEKKGKVSTRGSGSWSDLAVSERSAPDPSARKGSRSEGSIVMRGRIEFPDRVQFSYDEATPLILNPLRCAELTRQIRGGTKEMPHLEDLYFKNEYIDAASSRARSDGSMNFLVEKYDSALKQTMIQLGSLEKLAQARLKAIERVRAEHKKANEKAAKENEILRVKFEELEGKLKSAGAAKKELAQENTRLEQAAATLEKEKTELLEERDAAVEKLIGERQRLRDYRGLEVTRERERVEAAMVEKANCCYGREGKSLPWSGARPFYSLGRLWESEEPVRSSFGDEEVPRDDKGKWDGDPSRNDRRPLSDSNLTLSPLVLPSRFIEDRFRASFDPYGSNEPLVDITSVPAEHVEVPEGGGLDERPENENLEEVPGKDNLETGDTPVREEETESVGIEDPVLVSDSSSEGREDEEEEDDRVEETSLSQPVEEETTNEVGDRDVPPPPAVDSLVHVPTRVEDPTAAATEDPVGPPALGTPGEDDQDYVP
ncbi:hypothetical protein F2Q68_00011183 [Brassica cretica]|uniref:Uncharacterized protein n=1 Tax=Brassica cretica TaxID=69181 RepID=A0A8S9KZY4_BRACR|nr:hypothetical protein F2Q68_00011183 [Brassica cretica]